MSTITATKKADVVREDMRRHRAATPKRPVHPGVTQKEAGLTRREAERLMDGVCSGLADTTERGERIAHRVLAVLAVALGLALAARPLMEQLGWLQGGH